jgi:hypothetical protein
MDIDPYTPPPVVYAVPDTEYPYTYPDPAFIEKYGTNGSPEISGEWVVVPGQYVNETWVNEHKVWVVGSQQLYIQIFLLPTG